MWVAMVASDQQTPPPDWNTLKEELRCPLCDYNLRGLTVPRCPECGFKFEWQELLDAQRITHPYLFEYHPKRNIWSFWKTYWSDFLAGSFWKELSPANPVRKMRLLIYWLAANLIFLVPILVPIIQDVAGNISAINQRNFRINHIFTPVAGATYYRAANGIRITAAQYRQPVPSVFSWNYLRAVLPNHPLDPIVDPPVVELLLWPWLTLVSLLVFQISMRRAKIKFAHVLRCAIYGCNFGFLAAGVLGLLWLLGGLNQSAGYILLLIFPIVGTYRLAFAYEQYLRFSHPFLTVAASQFVVLLAMLDVIVNWTNWW
jgi:hypothetical protein